MSICVDMLHSLVPASTVAFCLHCESKNCATFIFTVTLANGSRFLKFFQCRNQKEMAHNKNEKISHRSLTLLLHYLVKLTLV